MAQIMVIGAGVIGLQTAVTLLEAGYKVTVVARDWPGDHSPDYTSPWAGAIWRSHASADQVEACKWDLQSYQEWMRIAETNPDMAAEMGIMPCRINIYSELSTTSDPWYAKHMKDYKNISGDGLPTLTPGHAFTSFAINPEKYLEHLQSRAKSAGALFITTNLPTNTGFASSIEAAVAHADVQSNSFFVVVNCTGLSASQFCGDENVFPIRGQTLLIRFASPMAREITLWEAKDAVTYIVPRPGTDMFIFGGTKDSTNVDTLPTPSISEDIQNRCRKLLASKTEGGKIEIIAEQVGFRPGRKGGVRIEVEDVGMNQGRPVRVVHNYGHAGAGYQASIGSAIKVLKLVQDMHAV